MLEELRPVARKAAKHGADMLISTSGILTMILATHGITEIEGVPFLDSVGVAIKTAELLVDLKKMGVDRVRRGLFTPLSKEELSDVRKLYNVE